MNDEKQNGILEQIGDDPFVQSTWFFTVTWFVIKVIALIAMVIYVICKR